MTGQWHPDATALAEYRAGLTGGRRARRLAAHVASCADCTSVNDQLAAVTTVLASAPEPTMPDAVESRIMAALATEAALVTEASPVTEAAHSTAAKRGTALSPVGGDGGGSRRRPGGRSGRSGPGNRWLRPAVLASAAAACLVLFGGVYGITHLSSGSSSSSAASSAAAGSESSALADGQAPGTHTRLEPADSAPAGIFTVTASGTNYLPATLAPQVRAQLARPARTAALPATPSAQLSACVLHLTGHMRPSLVDRAMYQGKPAYVIAVTNWAWVVGTGCTASNPELIASVGL
ncbi:MAG TPA: hypothetical protein VMC83_28555 [Streptosporangiaceae bacterium]|nr:hypothetical protein [Streptosporangiaceae bacterium]